MSRIKGYLVKWSDSAIYFIDESRIVNVVSEKAFHTASQAKDLKQRLEKIYFGRFEIIKI